ncbi:hypothetical protein [Streptomyces sp. NPDC046197]|uniref:hypothetical protein n=1 Tax=Streptomyces sp. NPDC046197 TaxID=3154337 RepID=UPI0034046B91
MTSGSRKTRTTPRSAPAVGPRPSADRPPLVRQLGDDWPPVVRQLGDDWPPGRPGILLVDARDTTTEGKHGRGS